MSERHQDHLAISGVIFSICGTRLSLTLLNSGQKALTIVKQDLVPPSPLVALTFRTLAQILELDFLESPRSPSIERWSPSLQSTTIVLSVAETACKVTCFSSTLGWMNKIWNWRRATRRPSKEHACCLMQGRQRRMIRLMMIITTMRMMLRDAHDASGRTILDFSRCWSPINTNIAQARCDI